MPRRGGRHQVLLKGASQAMQEFRMEIARDLGLEEKVDDDGSFKNFTTAEVGSIGGEMSRRMIAMAQYVIVQRFEAGEQRLLPPELLPPKDQVRESTNTGNMTLHMTQSIDQSVKSSGQQLH